MTDKKFILKADERKMFGRKVKSLREKGVVPANVYGKKVKSYAIQIPEKDFKEIFKEAGETSLIELQVDKNKSAVLISDVQLHPVTDEILHIDFRQVDLKEKVTATVPVELIGEAPAEKLGMGTLVQLINDVEVEALPMDFPDKLEVDVSELSDVDAAVMIKDLNYDKTKIKLEAEEDQIVAKIDALQEEEEEPQVSEEGSTEGTVQEVDQESSDGGTEEKSEEPSEG